MRIYLAGVRGSRPVHGAGFAKYGGATTSVYVELGGDIFLLDAGSGLDGVSLESFCGERDFTLLISHPHVDHLLGFPMLSQLFDPKRRVDVYLKTRNGLDARAQLEVLMSPPLWPISTSALKARVELHDIPPEFRVGNVKIETLEVSHPGGCTAFRLSSDGESLVFATDFEPSGDDAEFVEFARDCGILLLDAQYTETEYAHTRGFGHGTIPRALELSRLCGAKQTILLHHDPSRTDAELDELSRGLAKVRFGRAGEELAT